jgi:hypothetical protein
MYEAKTINMNQTFTFSIDITDRDELEMGRSYIITLSHPPGAKIETSLMIASCSIEVASLGNLQQCLPGTCRDPFGRSDCDALKEQKILVAIRVNSVVECRDYAQPGYQWCKYQVTAGRGFKNAMIFPPQDPSVIRSIRFKYPDFVIFDLVDSQVHRFQVGQVYGITLATDDKGRYLAQCVLPNRSSLFACFPFK